MNYITKGLWYKNLPDQGSAKFYKGRTLPLYNWMWRNDSLVMRLTCIFSSDRKLSQYSVCVYFYMYVPVPVYVCRCMYVCVSVLCVHVCVLVYISGHVYLCVFCGVCVLCMNVCMCVCQCMSHVTVCMCVLRCVSVCVYTPRDS